MDNKLVENVAMAHRFTVSIDDSNYQLGHWSSASGLNVSWQKIEHRTGDKWNHPYLFPGFPEYQKIKLTRAACKDSVIVQRWLKETAMRNEPMSGEIALAIPDGEAIKWEIREFFPSGWSISDFDAAQGKVAIETLELVHSGFLDDLYLPAARGTTGPGTR
ncbi:hypothetical protein GTY41_07250 [Streptomyces sp. SID685]|uniref:phage tail protein n=1 Tax=Streptomyces TaxID=1883 RepID=UPI001372120B|nr:phage tail protein [Streptomyces sp. SID685]MYR84753.1 hypothetical protein [Streptomyces sp. SID685]